MEVPAWWQTEAFSLAEGETLEAAPKGQSRLGFHLANWEPAKVSERRSDSKGGPFSSNIGYI